MFAKSVNLANGAMVKPIVGSIIKTAGVNSFSVLNTSSILVNRANIFLAVNNFIFHRVWNFLVLLSYLP
jgi:hypothetical protein